MFHSLPGTWLMIIQGFFYPMSRSSSRISLGNGIPKIKDICIHQQVEQ